NRRRIIQGEYLDRVKRIIDRVREDGDEALTEFTHMYDGVRLSPGDLQVAPEEIKRAYEMVSEDFLRALRIARDNILKFHSRQLERSWFEQESGLLLGQMISPLDSVGI